MIMEIEGKIVRILPVQEGVNINGNPWKKKVFVLETDEQYPKKICFDVFANDTHHELFDNCNFLIDEKVHLEVSIESREFNGRFYTDVHVKKILDVDNANVTTATTQPPAAPAEVSESETKEAEPDGSNELPF